MKPSFPCRLGVVTAAAATFSGWASVPVSAQQPAAPVVAAPAATAPAATPSPVVAAPVAPAVSVKPRASTPPSRRPAMVPAPLPPQVKLPANIAARVGGRDISRDEVLAVFDMVGGRPIIGQMVQAAVLEGEAKRQGITVTDAELIRAVQDMKDRFVQSTMQNGGKPMTFVELAKLYGVNENYIRYSAHLDLLRRKTYIKVQEALIPSLSDQIKLEHILIATIPLGQTPDQVAPTPAEVAKRDADAKIKIEGIQADIAAKKTTFEEAAKRFSDDKGNAANGGALSWATRDTFDPTFAAAAFSIRKTGDVAGPVKSQFGYHLIKLIARGSDAPAAEKAAYKKEQTDRIATQANNSQAVQAWFNDILGKANISVNATVRLVPNAKSPAATVTPAPARKTASR